MYSYIEIKSKSLDNIWHLPKTETKKRSLRFEENTKPNSYTCELDFPHTSLPSPTSQFSQWSVSSHQLSDSFLPYQVQKMILYKSEDFNMVTVIFFGNIENIWLVLPVKLK